MKAAVRQATIDDGQFLSRMFVEATLWRPGWPRVALEVLVQMPELARYFAAWGGPGDTAVVAVAETDGPVGAAWFRFFTDDEPGYGFVSASIPEIGIAVEEPWRGRGVGRMLLHELQRVAQASGHRGLSLSVHAENPAQRLYLALGFRVVRSGPSALTMLWRWKDGL